MTAGSDAVGYIVLTSQPDASWKDDWDGEVHTDFQTALIELGRARSALGGDGAKLAGLTMMEV